MIFLRIVEAAQILLLGVGIVVLIRGRIGLSRGPRLEGASARVVGGLMAAMLPLTVLLYFIAHQILGPPPPPRPIRSYYDFERRVEYDKKAKLADANIETAEIAIGGAVFFTLLLACAGVVAWVVWQSRSKMRDELAEMNELVFLDVVPPPQ